MTVGELERRMDSQELTEWMAFTTYYEALPDSWRQTGMICSGLVAPYVKRDQQLKPEDFIPIAKPPRHPDQDIEAIHELRRQLGIE